MLSIFLIFLFSFLPIYGYEINFTTPEFEIKKLEKCNYTSKVKFSFKRIDYSKNPITIYNYLEKIAGTVGSERKKQLDCIKSIELTPEEKSLLEVVMDYNRSKELESLDYQENFYLQFDAANKMAGDELALTKKFLKSKKDIYSLIYKKSMEYLFYDGSELYKEEDFKNLYLSSLRLHFEFYINLSPNLRKEIFKKLP